MHDMRIALDDHLVLDANGTVFAYTANIVSAEIEQHDMFRPLFRIGQKLLGEGGVFCRGAPASARAGDRPDGGFAVFDLRHNFRGGPNQVVFAET